MIDLHNHLLPGVDDGSRSVAQSLRVLSAFAAQGVTAVCLTPHLMASDAAGGRPADHDLAFAALLAAAPTTPRLLRGAEIMLDRPLPDSVARQRSVTLNGTQYALVEFTRMVTFQTAAAALAHVVELGLVPVLAHPERYACCTPEVVRRWRSLGAVMQVDGTTLATARDFLREHGGGVQSDLLLDTNPAANVAGGHLEEVPPLPLRTGVISRLRNLLSEGDS